MDNRKYGNKAVIEPSRVIQERKMIGLHPSCPVPDGAIMCYDAALWQWIKEKPGYAENDGWLKGSYLASYNGSWVLILKVPGFGAPTAVLTLEELIAFGINTFVSLGAAGGIQKNMNIGDIVVCPSAIREEGTSLHYVSAGKFAYASKELTEHLCTALGNKGIQYSLGSSWTTDAPYRETIEKLRRYSADGIATVEMEASALFAVGDYRKVSVGAVFSISDLLSEQDWKQGYHSKEKLDSLKRIFEAALEAIALRTNKSQSF